MSETTHGDDEVTTPIQPIDSAKNMLQNKHTTVDVFVSYADQNIKATFLPNAIVSHSSMIDLGFAPQATKMTEIDGENYITVLYKRISDI